MLDVILSYNNAQLESDICNALAQLINSNLTDADCKIWHGHPVWFLDGNPIVGYSKLKSGIRLMFWSGADFNESILELGTGKFKDASITYHSISDIVDSDIIRCLNKSKIIQWDYKNLVKRKGILEKLLV